MVTKTFIFLIVFIPCTAIGQTIEKIIFNAVEPENNYYLAIRPLSGQIEGAVVLFCGFANPENILPETKLHNVASANNILTIVASVNSKLYLDTATTQKIDSLLTHVARTFSIDTSKFVLGGFNFAGSIILRYAERAYEHPAQFPILPKAVFAVDSPVDLFGLWTSCERQIKKNYSPINVSEANYILNILKKEIGNIDNQRDRYKSLSPFYNDDDAQGNEKHLKDVPVRLYYDTDIVWYLKNKRDGFYDTHIPDGSELISRLLLAGNIQAEFIAAKQPGMRSNGLRNPHALSIVDEVELIQWVKQKLDIFDPINWTPPYTLSATGDWGTEHFALPPPFAKSIPFKGVEDIRFAPGWENPSSPGYWTYAYLWWLPGDLKLDENLLQQCLKAYYEGLVGSNVERQKIAATKVVPTVVKIEKIKGKPGGDNTFKGTVSMLDYMAQKPIVLNCQIQVRKCSKHTAILFALSPQPLRHNIWEPLLNVSQTFQCEE